MLRFENRVEAGQKLAQALIKYKDEQAVVFSLPRGGVILGAKIADELNLPHDLIITRKIGHPLSPEYAIGAVAENGDLVVNYDEVVNLDPSWFKEELSKQRQEAKRRRQEYLGEAKKVDTKGKIAILVDDGIATGYTIEAAIKELKHLKPKEIVLAVPVAPRNVLDRLKGMVDKVICLEKPQEFAGAIGSYYDDFSPVNDREVINLLKNRKAVVL